MLQKILLVTVFYGFSCVAAAFCTKPLKVGFAEWPPYQMFHNDKYFGLDIEFAENVTNAYGCPLSFVNKPWNSQLTSVHDGKLDLALGVTSTTEREKYAYFSDPYRKEVVKLFVLFKDLNKYKINHLNELKKLNILLGAELGFYYGEEFRALMASEFAEQVRMVIYTDINVKKLINQQIDAFIADQMVGEYYISKLGYNKQIVALPIVINETDVRIMVSKSTGSMEFMQQLNQQINILVKSEKYKQLEAKYLKK